jgi:hypothetical protein
LYTQVPQAPCERQVDVSINGRDDSLSPPGTKARKRDYDRLIGKWLQGGRQIQPGRIAAI